VLAIDDNPEAIEIIRKYLGDEYHVVGLTRGEGAVATAKEIRPVVITLDIMMPGKDGWQVLQELKSTPETQDIPVIILSIVDEKETGFSLGAAEYLVKPVEKQILLRKMKNLERKSLINSVLVVDSEPDTVSLITDVLNKSGYQVATAGTGEEAIRAVRESMPDLIILDLTMSEINGFDVIAYMKDEQIRNVPLIVLTRKDLSEEEIHELNGRIRGVLRKGNITQEAFLQELRHSIDDWSADANRK
jgi:CheY-like chemotaxis protein